MITSVTEDLFTSLVLDVWPRPAAIVDFGVDSQKHYEALAYPIRSEEITKEQLQEILGDGPAITKMVQSADSNPHKDIVFTTLYDEM